MNNLKKGFTLIELLIVIAILAVLSVAVVLALNPAELLKQARDSTRVSDMAAVNKAIALYLEDVPAPGIGGAANAACPATLTTRCTYSTTTSPFATGACGAISTSTAVNGTGWVTIDFTQISAGNPISSLPVDPVNSASYLYAYGCNALGYKIGTVMESNKYGNPTTGYMRNSYDGGISNGWYEVGNNLAL